MKKLNKEIEIPPPLSSDFARPPLAGFSLLACLIWSPPTRRSGDERAVCWLAVVGRRAFDCPCRVVSSAWFRRRLFLYVT